MPLPLMAAAAVAPKLLETLGKVAKGGGAALTAGKFLDAAIPGRSEKALRGVQKDARTRLERGQYGYSDAEKEQMAAKGAAVRAQTFKQAQMPIGSTGTQSVRDMVAQKSRVALLDKLQGGVVQDQMTIEERSRKAGAAQQAQDITSTQALAADTKKRTAALVGELPDETKKGGLASNLLEGAATLGQKKKSSDEEVMKGITSGTLPV